MMSVLGGFMCYPPGDQKNGLHQFLGVLLTFFWLFVYYLGVIDCLHWPLGGKGSPLQAWCLLGNIKFLFKWWNLLGIWELLWWLFQVQQHFVSSGSLIHLMIFDNYVGTNVNNILTIIVSWFFFNFIFLRTALEFF